eukprot:jgi/Tetstr1/449915/TSEL_036969.t1
MEAYSADMEAARREAPADIEWPKLDGHHGIAVLNAPLGSPEYVFAYMRGKAEELREEVDASLSKLLSAKPSRRYTHALHHHAWAMLKHCMQHKAGYWLRNCLPSEVEAFAEAVLGCHRPRGGRAARVRVLGRGSFNATSSARRHDHFLNDAHGSDSYAVEMREAWGRLQAATAGHLGDAYARVMEREVEAASGSQKELTAFLDQANNSRLRNEIILPSTEHNPVTVDLYGDALMNLPAHGDAHWRVQHDAIADAFRDHCVHDLELSLPAFNVVTGSYDPRSLKSTLLEIKTMRYGVKYTAVPRATVVDRFERSMLGDIQRGLPARDAAWHNTTEPRQKGPLRDILDMSEYTGMVLGTVGEEGPPRDVDEPRLWTLTDDTPRGLAEKRSMAAYDEHLHLGCYAFFSSSTNEAMRGALESLSTESATAESKVAALAELRARYRTHLATEEATRFRRIAVSGQLYQLRRAFDDKTLKISLSAAGMARAAAVFAKPTPDMPTPTESAERRKQREQAAAARKAVATAATADKAKAKVTK